MCPTIHPKESIPTIRTFYNVVILLHCTKNPMSGTLASTPKGEVKTMRTSHHVFAFNPFGIDATRFKERQTPLLAETGKMGSPVAMS
jgi:hypothetical protein